jgi:hypothetical protein
MNSTDFWGITGGLVIIAQLATPVILLLVLWRVW